MSSYLLTPASHITAVNLLQTGGHAELILDRYETTLTMHIEVRAHNEKAHVTASVNGSQHVQTFQAQDHATPLHLREWLEGLANLRPTQTPPQVLAPVKKCAGKCARRKPDILLIGLTGRARSGKSTVANFLIDHHEFAHLTFAAPLKAALAQMFNLTRDHLEGDLKEVPLRAIGKSPRQLMQLLGTDWGRELVHPDLWVQQADKQLGKLIADSDDLACIVVSDVRFENEASWIRAQGGIVVHIQRREEVGVSPHASETGIDVHPSDLVIENDSDLNHLAFSVTRVLTLMLRNLLRVA